MAWIKLDDHFPDHPKIANAGPLAAWLYVCGLGYAARYLTDGHIPRVQVRRLADVDDAGALAARLVEVGLWEETADGYLVHDYLDYQPSRERALATREARQEAGARGGKQKASNLLGAGYGRASDNALAKSYPVPVPVPVPLEISSHPSRGEEQTPVRARPGRASVRATPLEGFEDWWGCYPRKIGKGKAREAWKARRLTAADVPRLVAAVERQCLSAQWQSEGGRFIPHPATWLSQERWEDEPEVALPAGARASPNGHGQFSPRFERTMDTLARFNAAGDREERR